MLRGWQARPPCPAAPSGPNAGGGSRTEPPPAPSIPAPMPALAGADPDEQDEAGQDVGEWAPYEGDDLDQIDREFTP